MLDILMSLWALLTTSQKKLKTHEKLRNLKEVYKSKCHFCQSRVGHSDLSLSIIEHFPVKDMCVYSNGKLKKSKIL